MLLKLGAHSAKTVSTIEYKLKKIKEQRYIASLDATINPYGWKMIEKLKVYLSLVHGSNA